MNPKALLKVLLQVWMFFLEDFAQLVLFLVSGHFLFCDSFFPMDRCRLTPQRGVCYLLRNCCKLYVNMQSVNSLLFVKFVPKGT